MKSSAVDVVVLPRQVMLDRDHLLQKIHRFQMGISLAAVFRTQRGYEAIAASPPYKHYPQTYFAEEGLRLDVVLASHGGGILPADHVATKLIECGPHNTPLLHPFLIECTDQFLSTPVGRRQLHGRLLQQLYQCAEILRANSVNKRYWGERSGDNPFLARTIDAAERYVAAIDRLEKGHLQLADGTVFTAATSPGGWAQDQFAVLSNLGALTREQSSRQVARAARELSARLPIQVAPNLDHQQSEPVYLGTMFDQIASISPQQALNCIGRDVPVAPDGEPLGWLAPLPMSLRRGVEAVVDQQPAEEEEFIL